MLTGQHLALEVEEFKLETYPAVRLSCPGDEDPYRYVRMITVAMLPLLSPASDLLVVQGDT